MYHTVRSIPPLNTSDQLPGQFTPGGHPSRSPKPGPAMAPRIRKVGLSMTPEIKLTAERIPLEVINNGNYGLLDELLSTDFVDHSPQLGVPPTRDGLKQSLRALKTAF